MNEASNKLVFKIALTFSCFILTCLSNAQSGFVKGKIVDFNTNEPLIGASVTNSNSKGTVADYNGGYIIKILVKDTLRINFLGYAENKILVNVLENDTIDLNVFLKAKSEKLNEIVISESKYEQKLSDVTVSMEIIKPEKLENYNETDLEYVLKKISGVEVTDGQPSIRGGSGYSYGAGSRVLLLLNDLPLMSADAGDIKWNFLPLENISQIEIIKGASSVIYGSSALNGVINFRTSFAKSIPETRFNLLTGTNFKPKRKELVWWESPRYFYNLNILHSQKIKNSDLIISSDYFHDRGYRENEYEKRSRFNFNYLHHDSQVNGLSYGMNVILMEFDKIDFFLWQNADSGAYKQNAEAISRLSGIRVNIDPFLNYYTKAGIKHNIKSRYFYTDNLFDDDSSKNSKSQSLFSEYQFYKQLHGDLKVISGFANKYSSINSMLYGNHYANELAFYTQIDKKFFTRLKLLFGFRLEQYFLDGLNEAVKPVFRSGINYQPLEHTHIRASLGQGYRYPSIAEKFTTTSVGALNVFPNPDLKAETGLSIELGLMQNLKLNSWLFTFDAAWYINRYDNMIEFIFGFYKSDTLKPTTLDDFGFKSLNVSNALIYGFDISLKGSGKIIQIPVSIEFGYVYSYPKDLDYTAENYTTENGEVLKYRNLHIFKSDLQIKYKFFSLGCYLSYHSKMVNIDSIFTNPVIGEMLLPGFPGYWDTNNKPYYILEVRFGIVISGKSSFSIVLKNALNKEYMIRPGDISQPRNISIKYSLKI